MDNWVVWCDVMCFVYVAIVANVYLDVGVGGRQFPI